MKHPFRMKVKNYEAIILFPTQVLTPGKKVSKITTCITVKQKF